MAIACVADYREAARKTLPRFMFDYIDGGSYGEVTLRRNVEDLTAVTLSQNVMRDVSRRSMRVDLFGQTWSMPVALGPVGFAGMFARRGEVQAARAASDFGLPFCLSTLSICSVEEVVKSVSPVWFQLYMIKDRGYMQALLERVSAARCPVLVLTVDLAASGARYRDVHTGMSGADRVGGALKMALQAAARPGWAATVGVAGRPHTFGNLAAASKKLKGVTEFASWVGANFDPGVTWNDLDWVRARWRGPIVVKGILNPKDANDALAAGADGLVVSNHGGRQLDGASSTIRALPAIVDAAAGRAPTLFDGGIRSGLDVLRAMALGAQGCLIGRAWAYALAARGGHGVSQMLEILRSELGVAMSLTGVTNVTAASRALAQ